MKNNKIKKYIFFSPHLDDAVFSCANLMNILSLYQNVEIKVVTFFTRADIKRETNFAREFVSGSGYNNADVLFADRKAEDKDALSEIRAEYIHYNFVDAAYRGYKDETEIFSGKIRSEDYTSFKEIQYLVKKHSKHATLIFAPLSIGSHVDHVLVHHAVRSTLDKIKTIYWSDYPYSLYTREISTFSYFDFELWLKVIEHKSRVKLISKYKSQITSIFKNLDNSNFCEKYFLTRS